MFSGNGTRLSQSKNESIDNEPLQKRLLQQQHLASEAAAALASKAQLAGNGASKSEASNRFRTPRGQDSSEQEREQFLINQDNNTKPNYPPPTTEASNKSQTIKSNNSSSGGGGGKSKKKAKLAKEETIDEDTDGSCSSKMVLRLLRRKRFIIPLIIISYVVAIYCLPYVEINPSIPKPLPHIPFNFRDGPLRPSRASSFKVERLFHQQVQGPESVALDSVGNMYMAIEGGFILYARLNKSAPINRSYYYDVQQLSTSTMLHNNNNNRYNNDASSIITTTMTPPSHPAATFGAGSPNLPDLVKIAELNGIKQLPYDYGKRRARDNAGGSWRRECQLDEKAYGPSLYSGGGQLHPPPPPTTPNDIDTTNNVIAFDDGLQQAKANRFRTNVIVSRCSKPLGLRLSPDERYLYVVDTLSGLFRISLQVPDKPHSTQRVVTKLVDFRQSSHMLPLIQLDVPTSQQQGDGSQVLRAKSYVNVSLRAVDDLTIDYGAGTRGGDMIYLSLASQNWLAIGFLYDLLEGRPSGAILRYDSGNNQLSLLDPSRVAHVRTSSLDLDNTNSRLYNPSNVSVDEPFRGIGAPRLDEDDVFDNRPLHFPNGIQLTDDKQAILIADTSNKRIVKHYIRGARKGTSDLWAWTPNFPDNIRRGYDKNIETYWVAGCGEDTSGKFDPLSWLNSWPMLRKYLLKQIYAIGWAIEQFGTHLLHSNSVRDFGYSFKVGHSLLENHMCPGMMMLQYNNHGDIIRSIHSKEFPNDLVYYSQANEVIDANNQEHVLYLSSPSYTYVTKLTLPTNSFDGPMMTMSNTIR